MDLRPHQENGIRQIRQSMLNLLRSGKAPRIMFAAPCSYGKTIVSAHILKKYIEAGKRGIFICDRIKLVNQSLEAFDNLGLESSVIQSYHDRFDISKPVQIASIASLEKFKHWPHTDIIMVDEAHSMRKSILDMMQKWDGIPFIGLSATPYSKGLGDYYNDLIVPTTSEQLLDLGYLCPVDYYGGKSPDLSNVKTKSLVSGGTDWTMDSLGEAYDKDEVLSGDIIENWLSKSYGKMTIAFSPSVNHSKNMVKLFNSNGIPAAHIDGYMTKEKQEDLFAAHKRGDFLILSCSRLLNTGYDEPGIECLIDCFPTKSITQYVQRAGRIMRTKKGKEKANYHDHAGNVKRHGFAECIVPESLHCGKSEFSEKKLTCSKMEPKVSTCPQCYKEMMGRSCRSCGYEMPVKERVITDSQNLELITQGKTWNKKNDMDTKREFYGMLKFYSKNKGYKSGWADNKYRERSGVWPNELREAPMLEPNESFKKYIKSQAIRYDRSKNNPRNKGYRYN